GTTATVLLAHLHGYRTRDPVGPQQDHVERVPALPGKPLLGVVGCPHVERGQGVDGATIGDREMRRDLSPGANTHPVGLVERLSAVQRLRMRLAIGPHPLLERTR